MILEKSHGQFFRGLLPGLTVGILLCQDVHHDDAYGTGTDIAGGGNGKAEAASAGKAHSLIGGAHVVGLTGSLTEAHGKQQAGSLEHGGHDGVGQKDGDHQSGNALDQIGAHDDGAGFRPGERAVSGSTLIHCTKRHGDKSESDAVIHQHLQEIVVQLQDVQGFQDQQEETCQNGGGQQGVAEPFEGTDQSVGGHNGAGDDAQLDDDVP